MEWGERPGEGASGNNIKTESMQEKLFKRQKKAVKKKKGKKNQLFLGESGKNIREKVGHLLNNKRDEADDESKMAEMLNCFKKKTAFIKRNVEKWFEQLGGNKGLMKTAAGEEKHSGRGSMAEASLLGDQL